MAIVLGFRLGGRSPLSVVASRRTMHARRLTARVAWFVAALVAGVFALLWVAFIVLFALDDS
jgi:hypothetical protein